MNEECRNSLLQVVILVKVVDEPHPPEDCPRILAAVCTKDEHGNKDPEEFEFTDIGKGSNCVHKGMQNFKRVIPWTSFFHGFRDPLPQHVAEHNFILDLYLLRRQVVDVYRVWSQLQHALMSSCCLLIAWLTCTIRCLYVALHCLAYVCADCGHSTIWHHALFKLHCVPLIMCIWCRTQGFAMPEMYIWMLAALIRTPLQHHKAVSALRDALLIGSSDGKHRGACFQCDLV